jgi:hypothetical protein
MRTDITIKDGNVGIVHDGRNFGSYPAAGIMIYRSVKDGYVTIKLWNVVLFEKLMGDVWVNGTQLDDSNMLSLTKGLACGSGGGTGGTDSSAYIDRLYMFSDEAARDSYFAANPSELIDGLFSICSGELWIYGQAEGGWFFKTFNERFVSALPGVPDANTVYYIPEP